MPPRAGGVEVPREDASCTIDADLTTNVAFFGGRPRRFGAALV